MRMLNGFAILAAALIVAGAPTLVFAGQRSSGGIHAGTGFRFHAHLGGSIGPVTISRAGLGGRSRLIHAQRNRNATAFDGFPWDWSYGSYAVVAPPEAPELTPAMTPAPTPVAELPRCRESVDGVSIVRGKSCRT